MTKAPRRRAAGAARRAGPRAAGPAIGVSPTPATPRVERDRGRARERSGSARDFCVDASRYLVSPSGRFLLVSPRLRALGVGSDPGGAGRRHPSRLRDRGRRSREVAGRRREDCRGGARAPGCGATTRSSRSAEASRRTWRVSPRRSCCAAWRGTPCRRRRPAWPTPRSAGRPASTIPAARTCSARSTPRARSSRIPACLATLPGPRLSRRARRGVQGGLDRATPELAARASEQPLDAIARARRRGPGGAARGRRARQGRDRRSRSRGTRDGGGCSTSATRSGTRSRRAAALGNAPARRGGRLGNRRGAGHLAAARRPVRGGRRGDPPDARAAWALSRSRSATRRGSRPCWRGDKKATAAGTRASCSRRSGGRRVEDSVADSAEWLDAAAIMSLS